MVDKYSVGTGSIGGSFDPDEDDTKKPKEAPGNLVPSFLSDKQTTNSPAFLNNDISNPASPDNKPMTDLDGRPVAPKNESVPPSGSQPEPEIDNSPIEFPSKEYLNALYPDIEFDPSAIEMPEQNQPYVKEAMDDENLDPLDPNAQIANYKSQIPPQQVSAERKDAKPVQNLNVNPPPPTPRVPTMINQDQKVPSLPMEQPYTPLNTNYTQPVQTQSYTPTFDPNQTYYNTQNSTSSSPRRSFNLIGSFFSLIRKLLILGFIMIIPFLIIVGYLYFRPAYKEVKNLESEKESLELIKLSLTDISDQMFQFYQSIENTSQDVYVFDGSESPYWVTIQSKSNQLEKDINTAKEDLNSFKADSSLSDEELEELSGAEEYIQSSLEYIELHKISAENMLYIQKTIADFSKNPTENAVPSLKTKLLSNKKVFDDSIYSTEILDAADLMEYYSSYTQSLIDEINVYTTQPVEQKKINDLVSKLKSEKGEPERINAERFFYSSFSTSQTSSSSEIEKLEDKIDEQIDSAMPGQIKDIFKLIEKNLGRY